MTLPTELLPPTLDPTMVEREGFELRRAKPADDSCCFDRSANSRFAHGWSWQWELDPATLIQISCSTTELCQLNTISKNKSLRAQTEQRESQRQKAEGTAGL